jgi:putative Mg2+ transporter-C (MgtC) family protein
MIFDPAWGEIALRLAIAVLIGAAIGTHRHLQGQAAGLRTHAMVSLAAALAVLMVVPGLGNDGTTQDSISPVVQGIVTGVGFIGAGLILHRADNNQIHGLTSAAAIWITAVFGALCGRGRLALALIGFALIAIVLLVGARIEDAVRMRFSHLVDKDDKVDSDRDRQ